MGGETSKFIRLETDCGSGRVGIDDYQTNGDCAAGGSFVDQQASRLPTTSRTSAASCSGRKPPRSPPCSVFAKSMIRAAEGYQPPEVLRASATR
jgi:activator of 2-hydroxyglutaryl-CoA dehydratase